MHPTIYKMRTIIFDTSSLISLATNNLLYTLAPLKKQFNGHFFITESVHKEIIDNPMKSKRFKLEAFLIQDLFNTGVLEVYNNPEIQKQSIELLNKLNNTYFSHKTPIKILDLAEVESLVLAHDLGAEAYVVDERTMRLIVENPFALANILADKLHSKIEVNNSNLKKVKSEFSEIKVLRSTEVMLAAYNMGLFDSIIGKEKKKKIEFIDGLLWALKLHGCSITEREIQELLNYKNL